MAAPRKKRTTIITPKPAVYGAGIVREAATTTVGEELAARVREMCAYASGDQTKPDVILWPDGDRRWLGVLPELKDLLPELYSLGDYLPAERTGPAIWLRCIEARTESPRPPADRTPIFYLPGVSRQQLRAVEDCPAELEPLVELQFRGAVWSHPNGKDWSPLAFLSSAHGGLGLDVAGDAASLDALDRSLSSVLKEQASDLAGEKLDAQYFNNLLAPDLPLEILRWMNAPATTKTKKSDSEWDAFCAQCVADYKLHPEKDGELRAAEWMGLREGAWGQIWKRFAEAPHRYPGVVALLDRLDPSADGMLGFDREYWPINNSRDEDALAKALLGLKDKPAAEVAKAILALEKTHGMRRQWVWREIGRAPLACALEHLGLLAAQTQKALADASAAGIAKQYVESGWETDAAAMAALAAGNSPETDEAIAVAVRAVYLPWLDESARNLQRLALQAPADVKPRQDPAAIAPGRVVLFVDGLRFDLAHLLANKLRGGGIVSTLAWDWAAFPTVTATCKTAISPMAPALKGGGPEEEFSPCLAANTQSWTADRFRSFLADRGVQCLEGRDCGDPAGSAWTEAGTVDSRGHNEGARTAKSLAQEMRDVSSRIGELLEAGWKEIVVVTDHGWLLVPGGLPKIGISQYTVANRWGRCAAVKTLASTEMPTLPWHWNPDVAIATPWGAGCFYNGMEYAHGGISVQEMVVPRLVVQAGAGPTGQAKISAVKWVGLRCRVTVQNAAAGMKVDIRSRPADAKSSQAEGARPREIGADGTVSLIVEDDRQIGSAAVVVLLGSDGGPVQAMPTLIGENS